MPHTCLEIKNRDMPTYNLPDYSSNSSGPHSHRNQPYIRNKFPHLCIIDSLACIAHKDALLNSSNIPACKFSKRLDLSMSNKQHHLCTIRINLKQDPFGNYQSTSNKYHQSKNYSQYRRAHMWLHLAWIHDCKSIDYSMCKSGPICHIILYKTDTSSPSRDTILLSIENILEGIHLNHNFSIR